MIIWTEMNVQRYANATCNTELIASLGVEMHSSLSMSPGLQVGQKNLAQLFYTPQLYQILTDFQNYSSTRIRRKFVIILSLKIPSHVKCVATTTL